MFPFTAIFKSRTRIPNEPERSVLAEEYEWVFGKNPAAAKRTVRSHDDRSQDDFGDSR